MATGFANPFDAQRSVRWRVSVGIACLILAATTAFVAYLNIASVIRVVNSVEADGGYIREGGMTAAVLIIAAYCLVAVAYCAVGVWGIVARRSASSVPVIATIVVSGLVFIAVVAMLAESASAGSTLHFAGIASNVVIIMRSIQVLRSKKAVQVPTNTGGWTPLSR
ncbi:hypothetical protein [Arthrobacter sp. NyZ413]|uniref:hypothetical protein n=1 Tax=Arthrobacter sp. NyZ413 TaxID=3144669 RepID=UPI003BF879EF